MMKSTSPYAAGYQAEIDGLRAAAVIAVIFYHFAGTLVPSGYLGVDVFFVISGYVITLNLHGARKTSAAGYFLNFYARRMKRLLPALLVCMSVTALLFVFLATRPPKDAFHTAALALTGFANMQLLYLSQDYFALDAQLNPFTQTWSLGVEEQFYFIYPALFLLIHRSARTASYSRGILILSCLAVISLCGYLYLSHSWRNAAFYLMPARFWELGAGGIVFMLRNRGTGAKAGFLAPVSALALLSGFFLPESVQPAATAWAVACTSLLILTINPGQTIHTILTWRPVVFTGRISYSLYLWHWSMLVLGRWSIGTSAAASAILLALTVLLAILTYFLIEKPLRYANWASSNLRTIAAGLAVMVPAFVIIYGQIPQLRSRYNNNLPAMLGISGPGEFADVPCHGREKLAKLANPFRVCLSASRTAAKPHVIYLLGDSHAAQLYAMASDAADDLPYSVRFINMEDPDEFPQVFIGGNSKSKLLDFLIENGASGDIIAVSFHRGHLNDIRDRHIPLSVNPADMKRADAFAIGMRPYLQRWLNQGGKVIFIQDTPLMAAIATSSTCAMQQKLFGESSCSVTIEQDLHTRTPQDMVYTTLAREFSQIRLWDPLPLIYRGNSRLNVARENGEYVMWDWNHITGQQSKALAPHFREFLLTRMAP